MPLNEKEKFLKEVAHLMTHFVHLREDQKKDFLSHYNSEQQNWILEASKNHE